MKYLFVLIFLFIGCNKASVQSSYPAPQGKLVFSIEVLSSALGTQITGKTGYFFYLSGYPTFTIYQYRQGQIIGRSGLGSRETSELLEELNEIGFEELDLETEIKKAKINWKRIADQNGEKVMEIATMDGAEYKLQFNYEENNFTLQMWNPKAQINLYSPYNKKIKKLRSVIDLFAESYGHSQFGI
tara:strand:- start:588 stop:1145 length:558 start_codon:yes stop_codon:yes gene_type:complete